MEATEPVSAVEKTSSDWSQTGGLRFQRLGFRLYRVWRLGSVLWDLGCRSYRVQESGLVGFWFKG